MPISFDVAPTEGGTQSIPAASLNGTTSAVNAMDSMAAIINTHVLIFMSAPID